MLAIRLKRTGRRGHAQFRVVVQDSHFHPTRGRVVSYLGSFDPHTKATIIDKEKASQYLGNGAQPSGRVIRLLQKEGVELPSWVKVSDPKTRGVRNVEKRRSTRPSEPATESPEPEVLAEEPVAEPAAQPAETPAAEEAASEPASSEEPEALAAESIVEEPSSKEPAEPAVESSEDK